MLRLDCTHVRSSKSRRELGMLFVLGMSLLLGGLKHHVEQFNRASARLQAALLFLGTVALLIPSVARDGGSPAAATYVQTLSLAAPFWVRRKRPKGGQRTYRQARSNRRARSG